jgi:hypothetical protein
MKICFALTLAALIPLPAAANCIPPWQTQFACNIPERNARAEFCHLADPKANPDKKEAYYTYAAGTEKAELYFETDSTWFSTKDTNINHPTDLTMALGYARGDYVYAFVVTQDKDDSSVIKSGEIRVYPSTDAFTNETKDTEIAKLYCEWSSILADSDSIRP